MDAATWFLLLAAPFVGSFLGVVAERLPAGRDVLAAPSACAGCGRRLSPAELLPVLSYLRQRGRCRCGRQRLGWFYPGIELAALLVVASALPWQDSRPLWLSALLGWTLLVLAAIDLAEGLLPDRLTLPLLAAGLLATGWLAPDALPHHLLGAALGYLAFAGINRLYRRVRGRDGLGGGDAKLLAAAGAWLGWQGLPSLLLIAAVAGLAAALLGQLAGRSMQAQSRIPFGPFLALGCWLVWLLGPLT